MLRDYRALLSVMPTGYEDAKEENSPSILLFIEFMLHSAPSRRWRGVDVIWVRDMIYRNSALFTALGLSLKHREGYQAEVIEWPAFEVHRHITWHTAGDATWDIGTVDWCHWAINTFWEIRFRSMISLNSCPMLVDACDKYDFWGDIPATAYSRPRCAYGGRSRVSEYRLRLLFPSPFDALEASLFRLWESDARITAPRLFVFYFILIYIGRAFSYSS